MAGANNPIFPATPTAAWATLTAANTAKDGTGVTATVSTAGLNGRFIESIRAMPIGTNVASVLRVFLNNGTSSAVAANNSLWYELQLPATTLSEVAAQTPQILTLQRAIPAGYKINVCLATAVAAGWQITSNDGDF